MTAMVCAILEQPGDADADRVASTSESEPLSGRSASAPSASAPSLVEVVHQLADAELEALLAQAASGRAEFDRVITVAAGEAAKRSERALGHGGLAQRRGHRTVIQFVQSLTGESKGEATRQVKVGELIGETDAAQRSITGSDGGTDAGTSEN
ncbi:MAG: hypothetical protein ACTHNX_05380, partial [Humibacter sp.]